MSKNLKKIFELDQKEHPLPKEARDRIWANVQKAIEEKNSPKSNANA